MADNDSFQKSHDELARSLVQIVDQLTRGSHPPTPAQFLDAACALRQAAPHLAPNAWGITQRYAEGMAELLTQKYGLEPDLPRRHR